MKILRASLSGPHGPVSVRWVDNSTREIGPDLSGGIIIPVRPLTPRAHDTASVTLRDGTGTISHTWRFTTGR